MYCSSAQKWENFGSFAPIYFKGHFSGSRIAKLLLPPEPRRVTKFRKCSLSDVIKSGDGSAKSSGRLTLERATIINQSINITADCAWRLSLVSGFDYDTSEYAKIRAIKQFLHLWAHAIDGLVRLDQQRRRRVDAKSWSLSPPGRSCNTTLQRRWTAGEKLVR